MSLSNEELLKIEHDKLRTEGDKLLHDTMKQLATISSAAIVIVVPFVEKEAHWRALIAVALVGFLISIIAAGICMRTISLKMGLAYFKDEKNPKDEATKHQRIEDQAFPIAVRAFLLAMGTLVVFVIRNIIGAWCAC